MKNVCPRDVLELGKSHKIHSTGAYLKYLKNSLLNSTMEATKNFALGGYKKAIKK